MLAIEQTNTYIACTTRNDAIGRQWLRDATALPASMAGARYDTGHPSFVQPRVGLPCGG
jgi:hypothetical protein